MNVTDDPGVKEALGFLMTREVAHQQSFEKALYSIEPNFPPGKLAPVPQYANVYYKMSSGPAIRGPWNSDQNFEFVKDPQPAVDGGDGLATVKLAKSDVAVMQALVARTASDPESNPWTGADLGIGETPEIT